LSTTWLLWLALTLLTGNPLGALVAVVVVLWLADRFTFRLLPGPVRAVRRWRRAGELRRGLGVNPHDRRARLELADLVLARHPAEAAALARANVEAGDEDVPTLYLLGAGLARSGQADAAERVLAAAKEREPGFRLGELDLELGRLRLRRGDFAGAREALERLVQARPGTVEGRWLLSRALAGVGDRAGVVRMRDEGWAEYCALPGFRRREERRYAWRLRPERGALAVVGVAAALTAAGALLLTLVGFR
jgi:hypothetical protein